MAKPKKILWADDEIDILQPHILFLEEKGYHVTPVNSGQDAIDSFKSESYDIVFLDENMPGLTGIETLTMMKGINPSIPIIMITKSEDEGIMTHAIGRKIADYLIKPVNPNQILLSVKKNLHKDDIVSEVTIESYRDEYAKISIQINNAESYADWTEIYKKLVYWEMELTSSQSPLLDLLQMQMKEANNSFCKYIKRNYESWIQHLEEAPLLSPKLLTQKVFPLLNQDEKIFVFLIDNFRLDQWMAVKDLFAVDFEIVQDTYFSILPTTTQYARNSVFSGLMPAQIASQYPDLWIDEDDDEGKNINEELLLENHLKKMRKQVSFSYNKLMSSASGEKLIQQMNTLKSNQLNVIIINFIDILSHARTDSRMIRELAADEAAYISLTRSWIKHSSTIDMIKKAASMGFKIILTTDHGTIRVKSPIKVVAGKDEINSNIRYKVSKNIGFNRKDVYDIQNPEKIGLPASHLSTKYIFACSNDFIAYPNNFNYYASYYADTFQHGGISMEEMIIPFITMTSK